MGIGRYELSDGQWERIAPLLPGKASDPGRTGSDNRLFVNGVLWVLRSGAHWRDLPDRYGKWKTAHQRFSRRRSRASSGANHSSESARHEPLGTGAIAGGDQRMQEEVDNARKRAQGRRNRDGNPANGRIRAQYKDRLLIARTGDRCPALLDSGETKTPQSKPEKHQAQEESQKGCKA